jgi:anti-sigma B factor antagonist
MRARGWRRQGGIMSVSLCIRPGNGGAIVAISGAVDVCTEASLQHSLLQVIRECGAKLMLDVSGVSFMDCAGLQALLATRRRAEMRDGFLRLIATSAAVSRVIELTGVQEALAMERSRVPFRPILLRRTDRVRRTTGVSARLANSPGRADDVVLPSEAPHVGSPGSWNPPIRLASWRSQPG